jgi:hypothetical protein
MNPSPEKSKQLFSGTAASAAARHLSRKLQHSVSYLRDKSALPQQDQLTGSSIQIDYVGDTGFPECADTIAYEPTQGLLAIGTTDGRIKLIGRLGVEATLRPASPVPTVFLGFLPNQGALVRVTKDGGIELFSLAAKRLLSSVSLRGEPGGVISVATLPGAPYILLGCASGNIKVISLLSRTGGLAEGCIPAASVKIQPYQILAEDLDSRGGVMALATTSLYTTTSNSSSSSSSRPLALITHHETGTLVWDIRSERILCAAIDDEEDNSNEATSRPTAGCWVGDRANAFAVGYDDGSILVWGVPTQALNSDPHDVIIPHEAELLMSLTVTPPCMYDNNSNSARNERNKKRPGPIREMKFLAGGPPPAGVDEDCLLVCGGQVEGEPEMLVVLPLRPQVEGYPEEGDGHRVVPWFGTIQAFTVVKPVVGVADDDNDEGYYGEESDLALPPPSSSSRGPLNRITSTQDASSQSLMILTEGGQLVVHDLRHCQPNPVTLPAQELPPITVSKVVDVRVLEEEEEEDDDEDNNNGGGGGVKSSKSKATLYKHTLSLAALRRCSTRLAFGGEEDIAQADWPFHGGKPAPLVTDVPPDYHHPCGLLLTGHRDGRVRVWDTSVAVPQLLHTVPSTATPTGGGNNQLQQNERLKAVSSLDTCPLSGLMIVGHVDGDVRLYQFSDHDSQEVHRSNIDEARVPYEHVGAQAAGFQYVTRYSVHSADVTAVVLASALKLAAVADAKGTVSLVDLMQPNQLFCSRPFTNAVVKLRFGFVPVPYPTTTTSTTGTPRPTDSKSTPPPPPPPPGVEEGLERLVLIAAADDSSLALIDLESGNLLPGSTKPLRPKNTARPLAMALLGPSGEPILNASLQGKTTLPWANNHDDNGVGGLTRKVPGLSFTSSQRPPLSGSVSAKSWANKISKTGRNDDDDDEPEQSFTVEKLPSSDDDGDDDDGIDSHLATAAAEVDNRSNNRKFKLKLPNAKGFLPNRKGSNKSDDVDIASPQTTSNNDVQDKSTTPRDAPITQDPVAALQRFYNGNTAGGSSSSLPPCSTPPQQGKTKGKQEEEEESPPCTFVVLATEDALRVYSTGSIRIGDRTSEKKARLDEPAGFAELFSSPDAGAGIITVAADGSSLSLYSVPNLQLLAKHTMESSSVLGYPWKNTVGAACACSGDGQLILCGSGSNEIVRMCLLEDTIAPSPPASTFDWAVAKAAAAAMLLVGDGSSHNNISSVVTQSRPAVQQQQHTTTLPPVNKSLDTSGTEMKSLSSIIQAVKGTAASVATSAVKAGSAFADSLPAGIASRSSSTSTSASARAPPSLRQLFDTTVTSLSELDLLEDFGDDDDNDDFVRVDSKDGSKKKDGRKKKLASPARLPASRPPLPTPNPPPPVSNREMRNELLGTGSKAKAAAPTFRQAKAHMRTASEIKRNYGRPGTTSSTNDKIGGLKGVMEKTRDALVERGEKLKSLQDKSEAMSNDAEDFAGMAHRLEQMYAEKKWWQF